MAALRVIKCFPSECCEQRTVTVVGSLQICGCLIEINSPSAFPFVVIVPDRLIAIFVLTTASLRQ